MKIYFVQVVDIWNNQSALGFYKDLNDAIPDINGCIFNEQYKLENGDIKEFASTFGPCFDTTVRDAISRRTAEFNDDEDDDLELMIRGYIVDSDLLINEINKVVNQ